MEEGVYNRIEIEIISYNHHVGLGFESTGTTSGSGTSANGIGKIIQQVPSLKRPLESTQNIIEEDSVKKQKLYVSKTMTFNSK